MSMSTREILEDFGEQTRPRFEVRDLPARERPTRPAVDHVDRFMAKVDKSAGPDGCWIWLGKSARFWVGPHPADQTSFRMFAWEAIHGAPPPGRLWPQCTNGKCCNPRHMATTPLKMLPGSRYRMATPTEDRKRTTVETPALRVVPRAEGLTAAGTLTLIMTSLDLLTAEERARILRALAAFYGEP